MSINDHPDNVAKTITRLRAEVERLTAPTPVMSGGIVDWKAAYKFEFKRAQGFKKGLDKAEAVVRAAEAWEHIGNEKVMHVLTCDECKRLERKQDKWCNKASEIGRRQLEAAKAIRDAVATYRGQA